MADRSNILEKVIRYPKSSVIPTIKTQWNTPNASQNTILTILPNLKTGYFWSNSLKTQKTQKQ